MFSKKLPPSFLLKLFCPWQRQLGSGRHLRNLEALCFAKTRSLGRIVWRYRAVLSSVHHKSSRFLKTEIKPMNYAVLGNVSIVKAFCSLSMLKFSLKIWMKLKHIFIVGDLTSTFPTTTVVLRQYRGEWKLELSWANVDLWTWRP